MNNKIIIHSYGGIEKDYQPTISSWEYYCDRYGLELVISKDTDIEDYVWSKWNPLVYDRLGDRNLFVDIDVMVRWDAPNIFDVYSECDVLVSDDNRHNKVGGYHYNQWKNFYDVTKINWGKYFNAGVMLLSDFNYKKLTCSIYSKPFYEVWDKSVIDGYEQTPVNILTQELFNSDICYTDSKWNNLVMHWYNDYSFLNDSYLWHFTGPRLGGWGKKVELINSIWESIKVKYS